MPPAGSLQFMAGPEDVKFVSVSEDASAVKVASAVESFERTKKSSDELSASEETQFDDETDRHVRGFREGEDVLGSISQSSISAKYFSEKFLASNLWTNFRQKNNKYVLMYNFCGQ
jgi:hypothetical protein